jgi:ribosomal 30S subunit maturation factor RimM
VITITNWWLQKFGERLVVNKQVADKFDEERYYLSKLSEFEVTKQYQITISKVLQLCRT